MVVVVDYGICNVRSVVKALELVGATVRVSSAPRDLEEAERIVLPGVGAFEHGMTNLAARGLIEPLTDQVLGKGKPFLGICLGMQLLARTSHEFGVHEGLGWLPATVKAFALEGEGLKVPHIGWTEVSLDRPSPLFAGVSKAPSFYFVHSYHMVCDTTDLVAASAEYGVRFTAAVQRDNIFATQFHPEKSQDDGLRLLENFLQWQT
jgi:imidazole glycerol-phosphate synthase subunit HisH